MRWSRVALIVLLLVRRLVPRAYVRTVRARRTRDHFMAGRRSVRVSPSTATRRLTPISGIESCSGDVMYRDLTENKPPLGYWLYTLAVALGGYDELAIRVLPIPFVLATIAMVWWIALRLGGPGSACSGRRALRGLEHGSLPVRQRRQPRAFHQLLRGRIARALDSWVGSRGPMVASWRRAFAWVLPRWSNRSPSRPLSSSSRPSRGEPGRERSSGDEKSCDSCSMSVHSGWAWCRSWWSLRQF